MAFDENTFRGIGEVRQERQRLIPYVALNRPISLIPIFQIATKAADSKASIRRPNAVALGTPVGARDLSL